MSSIPAAGISQTRAPRHREFRRLGRLGSGRQVPGADTAAGAMTQRERARRAFDRPQVGPGWAVRRLDLARGDPVP